MTSSAASTAGLDQAGSGAAGEIQPVPTPSKLDRTEQLRAIVREHFADVWRFLRRLGFERDVADDAAQDLFFVALRRVDDITPGRERAFLFGAALRIAARLKRKGARELPVERAIEEEEADVLSATLEQRLDEERARQLLYRLLSELEERFRVVFVMYELEGMTMLEISELLEIPPGTVASRLRSAREDFQARLARHRARVRHEEST
jgi:RNA polymerase sigma-70 factor (ECF subfamily)